MQKQVKNVCAPELPQSFVLPLRILNAIFLLVTFLVNGIYPAFAPNTVGEISAKFLNYLTPAGYAFSIWGIIYFFLAVFGVYQLIPSTYDSKRINQGYSYWLLINCIANSVWIVVWQNQFIGVSVGVILVILLTAGRIYIVLKREYDPSESWVEWTCTQVGISLYFAWLIAASIVNIYAFATTATEPYINISIFGLCLGAVIEGSLAVWGRDPFLSGVGAWAIFAIAINWNGQQQEIAITGFTLSALLLGLTFGLSLWHVFRLIDKRTAVKSESEESVMSQL
jgi:hypothetical protein